MPRSREGEQPSPTEQPPSEEEEEVAGIPTEAELVLLCLDHLRNVRRAYHGAEAQLADEHGVHADYLSVAIYALARSFTQPSLDFHSTTGNDACFDRDKANHLTPNLFPRNDPKSSPTWISVPNLATINQEILYTDQEDECYYPYDDHHPSNEHRIYPLQGLASGEDASLGLGELVAAGMAGLGARSRHDAEQTMIDSTLFAQFFQAVESKGFFKEKTSIAEADKAQTQPQDEEALYQERYTKVVSKFRNKLAVQQEDNSTWEAVDAAERQQEYHTQCVHQAQAVANPSHGLYASPGAMSQAPSMGDDFTVGMSVITSVTKKLTPSVHPVDEEEAERLKGMGNAYMQRKEYARAIEAYTAALKLSPAGPHSHVYFSNRAAAHLSQRDLEHAIVDSERSLALQPEYGKAHARLGLAYYLSGNHRLAVDAYTASLKYDPDNQSSQTYLEKAAKRLAEQEKESSLAGSVTNRADNTKADVRSLEEERKKLVDEREAKKHKAKGNSFMASRNYQAAMDSYSKAIQCSPDGPSSHVYFSNRAAALCYLERYVDAEADSLRSLALNPSYGKAHARLGLSRFFMCDYQGAIEAYTAALTYDPDNAASKSYLAKAKARLRSEMDQNDAAEQMGTGLI